MTHLQSSKVDDAINVGVGFKDLVYCCFICYVELEELGLLAADELDAVEDLCR